MTELVITENLLFTYFGFVLQVLCGLYYKPITIINYGSGIFNKLETSLTDDASRHLRLSHVCSTGHRTDLFRPGLKMPIITTNALAYYDEGSMPTH
jgi:hypothetical protein